MIYDSYDELLEEQDLWDDDDEDYEDDDEEETTYIPVQRTVAVSRTHYTSGSV